MRLSILPSLSMIKQHQRNRRWYIAAYFLLVICAIALATCERPSYCPPEYSPSSNLQTYPHSEDTISSATRISSGSSVKNQINAEMKPLILGLSVAMRGGDVPTVKRDVDDTTGTLSSPESVIAQFLSHQEKRTDESSESKNDKDDKFHVQGWRWHTLSFTRDSARLQKLATQMLQSPSRFFTIKKKNSKDVHHHPLTLAVNHVIEFNLKGLQRIENDLFFPWLRKKLTEPNTAGLQGGHGINENVIAAFQTVLDDIDDDRKKVAKLAERLKEQAKLLTSFADKHDICSSATSDIIDLSRAMCTLMKSIYTKEECLIIPAVAKIVPSKEQKSFNSQVLRKLGLLEARVHLVGMYDAVHDDLYGNKDEIALFDHEIPAIPRMMISRWRKTLYQPRAGVLDDYTDDK